MVPGIEGLNLSWTGRCPHIELALEVCSFEWACWRTGLLGYTPFEIPTINEHFVCYSVVQADVHMHGKIGASGLLSFQHMLSNVEFN